MMRSGGGAFKAIPTATRSRCGAAIPPAHRLARRETFLKARHVAVVIRGQNEDLIDGWLRPKEIERRIALVVPSYIEALHVAARTDLVAFVPRRLIAALAKPLSLAAVTPPLDPGIDEQFMFYPTRAQFDPGSIWLRHLMLQTGRELSRPSAKSRKAIRQQSPSSSRWTPAPITTLCQARTPDLAQRNDAMCHEETCA